MVQTENKTKIQNNQVNQNGIKKRKTKKIFFEYMFKMMLLIGQTTTKSMFV